jgi:hypothetical protein
MSVQLPDMQDNIAASSPSDVVRVPWTEISIPVGVQLTEAGAPSSSDWATFSAGLDLCLTPDQAAAYPVQREPYDWRSFPVAQLNNPDGQCSQQPYGTLGSWYHVYDDGGGALYPYSQQQTFDGSQPTTSGVIKVHWYLPYIANTLRLHLFIHSSAGSDDQVTDPVNLMVMPAALMQLKVLPYTILYAPPGANSAASYQGSTSFGTTMIVGSTVNIDDTATETRVTQSNDNIAASALGLSFNLSSDSSWDHTVTSGVGLATSSSTSLIRSDKLTYTLGSPAATTTTSPETYGSEPFWNDEVVLLLHPQLAVWDFAGTADVQMLGAFGSQNAPTFARPTLRQLDTCANGGGLADEVLAKTQPPINLSADECLALATLDPLYGYGQSVVPASVRAQKITEQEFGAGIGSYDIKDEQDVQLKREDAKEASYSASVEDLRSSSQTIGVGLTEGVSDKDECLGGGSCDVKTSVDISLTGGLKNTDGNRASYNTKMDITYRQSNAITEEQAIALEGKLDDAKSMHIAGIYFDNTFGTWMFIDPDAEVSPLVKARENQNSGKGGVGERGCGLATTRPCVLPTGRTP